MTYDEFIAQAPRYEPPKDFDAWLKQALVASPSSPMIIDSAEKLSAANSLGERRYVLGDHFYPDW